MPHSGWWLERQALRSWGLSVEGMSAGSAGRCWPRRWEWDRTGGCVWDSLLACSLLCSCSSSSTPTRCSRNCWVPPENTSLHLCHRTYSEWWYYSTHKIIFNKISCDQISPEVKHVIYYNVVDELSYSSGGNRCDDYTICTIISVYYLRYFRIQSHSTRQVYWDAPLKVISAPFGS